MLKLIATPIRSFLDTTLAIELWLDDKQDEKIGIKKASYFFKVINFRFDKAQWSLCGNNRYEIRLNIKTHFFPILPSTTVVFSMLQHMHIK